MDNKKNTFSKKAKQFIASLSPYSKRDEKGNPMQNEQGEYDFGYTGNKEKKYSVSPDAPAEPSASFAPNSQSTKPVTRKSAWTEH